jgi:hypothetical protein
MMMAMHLGWVFGAIALAVVGVVACNAGPCPSTVNTVVFPLPDAGDVSEDGGCQAACTTEMKNSLGWTSCSFTTQDGGKAVSCTGPIEMCP